MNHSQPIYFLEIMDISDHIQLCDWNRFLIRKLKRDIVPVGKGSDSMAIIVAVDLVTQLAV